VTAFEEELPTLAHSEPMMGDERSSREKRAAGGGSSELSSGEGGRVRPPLISPRLLGQILLRSTGLTPQQLERALEVQEEEGGRLGEILVRQHAATEEEVLKALAEQLDLPYLGEFKPESCDPELALKVPINFAKQHRFMPIKRSGRSVEVAVADPLDVHALDDIQRALGADLAPVIVSGNKILEVINKVYARQEGGVDLGAEGEDEMGGEAEELIDILDLTDEAPIIRWVNSLIFQAVKERASDIHIEPREKDLIVRYRIDGNLEEHKRANSKYINSILSRVKIMAGLNIAEKRLPQDGRIRRKIAGKEIDMRVATAPGVNGERITIRLLDRASVLHDLSDIGFGDDHLAVINELIHRPHGIILVTGPTGSGKTTTLYACLDKINTPDLNILTVEDPVEYQLEGITQVATNSKIDLTFASVLRSYLRHDPDVIMVGEIRDGETAGMAIQASLTGHLVFSTVHTNDATGAITRLVDMGIEPFLVASSLVGLLAQRLVRRLCPDCRVLYKPTDDELRKLNIDPEAFSAGTVPIPKLRSKYTPPPRGMLFSARDGGCPKCSKNGYHGRMGIYELLLMDNEIRQLALKNTDSNTIKQVAMSRGMRTLRDDGTAKVLAGVTTIEEVLMVTTEDKE
jgi:general secretion pathway protein E